VGSAHEVISPSRGERLAWQRWCWRSPFIGPLAFVLTVLACSRTDARPASRGAAIDVAAADRAIVAASEDSTQWPTYGRDLANRRYAPLSQITPANVAQLRLAWTHHSGIPHSSETNPLVVDSVMYFSSALNHVFAVDARTGRQRWEYVHDYTTTVNCCGPINRGVTVYGGRVFMATVDARLVALDAASGRKLWDVRVGDNEAGYHMTGAPLAIDGKVITGVSGGEQGCRCYVDAYDAATGERVWRWYTIPSPEQGGWWGPWRERDEWGTSFARDVAREHADSAKYFDSWQHGGGPAWHHPAYDPRLGLLFVNVGNPAPDLDGTERPGDNLYTNSVVALDVKTGTVRWYYQTVPHDLWDYDPSPPPVLVDVRDASGQVVPAVAQASKVPWVYVLDRRTGRPIRRSDPYVPTQNLFVPPNDQGVLIMPGTLGGTDWSPTAFDPRTGWLYLASNAIPTLYKRSPEPLRPPAQWWGGSATGAPTGTSGLISAIDLNTGKVMWQTPTAKPLLSGVTVTAGGVVFAGLSDDKLVALDARNGRQVWSANTPAGVNAPPITYMLDGVQYVAVAATGAMNVNSHRGDVMLAFSLPADTRGGAATAPARRDSTLGSR
jgi:alcohol dehydrogenase (cytochrome c)